MDRVHQASHNDVAAGCAEESVNKRVSSGEDINVMRAHTPVSAPFQALMTRYI